MFRFTIRDLLWLTVVAALAVTWWLDRQHLAQKYAASLSDMRTISLEGRVIDIDNAGRVVEVSLGTDDGLKLNDVVEIRRGKSRLGQVVINNLRFDTAVGRIDKESVAIRTGDTVHFKYDPIRALEAGTAEFSKP